MTARLKKILLGTRFGDKNTAYEILHKRDKLTPNQKYAYPISSGGAGVVFRALYKDRLVRAVKFIAPRRPLRSTVEAAGFIKTTEKERNLLASLTHSNIVKIVDLGQAEIKGVAYEFIATEYIEGPDLLPCCKDPDTDAQTVLSLLSNIITAMAYLGSRRVLHSDIKHDNVRCRAYGQGMEAILLDLGAAHVVPEPTEPTDKKIPYGADETYFPSTQRIACSQHQDNIVGKSIKREQLIELFPYFDLRAFGQLLKEVLEADGVSEKLRKGLGNHTYLALAEVGQRLLADPDDVYYASAEQLASDWSKLSPNYLAPLGVPELSIAAQFKHSILTFSRRVVVTDRLHRIVNHDMFQRLRNIPQLEMVSLIYPGATHTRLHHSLATFDTARLFLAHLLNDPQFRLLVGPRDVEATLLLGLLHDIGHYPLSHMFEDLADERRHASKKPPYGLVPRDDDLFWLLIDPGISPEEPLTPYAGEIRLAWERHAQNTSNDDSMGSIVDEIHRCFGAGVVERMKAIRSVVDGKDPGDGAARTLAALLSSSLDVDKIAYLLDDATASGVKFGAGIDLDGLLGSLRSPAPTDVKESHPILAITDKGVAAAESVVIARQLMLRRVYWHHTNRAIMAMVKHLIASLLIVDRLDFSEYVSQNLFSGQSEALTWLSAEYNRTANLDQLDTNRRAIDPTDGLRNSRRMLHKRLLSLPHGREGSDDLVIWDRLAGLDLNGRAELEEELMTCLEHDFGFRNICYGEILVDVPFKDRSPSKKAEAKEALKPVVKVYPRGAEPEAAGVDIREYTPIFKNMVDEYLQMAQKARVFVSQRLQSNLSGRETTVANAFREVIAEFQASSGNP